MNKETFITGAKKAGSVAWRNIKIFSVGLVVFHGVLNYLDVKEERNNANEYLKWLNNRIYEKDSIQTQLLQDYDPQTYVNCPDHRSPYHILYNQFLPCYNCDSLDSRLEKYNELEEERYELKKAKAELQRDSAYLETYQAFMFNRFGRYNERAKSNFYRKYER